MRLPGEFVKPNPEADNIFRRLFAYTPSNKRGQDAILVNLTDVKYWDLYSKRIRRMERGVWVEQVLWPTLVTDIQFTNFYCLVAGGEKGWVGHSFFSPEELAEAWGEKTSYWTVFIPLIQTTFFGISQPLEGADLAMKVIAELATT